MKKAVIGVLIALGVLGALIAAAFLLLEDAGAFSPEKCAANGGVWDHGVEVCNSR